MASVTTLTVTCDRCKKSEEYPSPANAPRYNDWGEIKFQYSLGSSYIREYDLCSDCRRDFMNWVSMKEILPSLREENE